MSKLRCTACRYPLASGWVVAVTISLAVLWGRASGWW